MESQRLRAVNASIARNYDTFVYDPQPDPQLVPGRICGQAALFGKVRRPADVLDIGCGTGVQLQQAAPEAAGRLVGVDISAEACKRARNRLAALGERATIACADVLELPAEQLGKFDVIFNIGVIYVTPEPVRRKIVELIGQCLRPGGVALVSYYAGTLPALRANIHRSLRAATAGMPAGEAVAASREWLAWLAGQVAEAPVAHHLHEAIAQTQQLSDTLLFHEALNCENVAMQTSWLERELADHGLKFAGYLPPSGLDAQAGSLDRALAADAQDMAYGAYRYALFVKDDSEAAPNFRADRIVWETVLRRDNSSELGPGELRGAQSFVQPGTTVRVTLRKPACIAMHDLLAEGACSWAGLAEKARQRLIAAGLAFGEDDLASMAADLHLVWKHGLAFPRLT